MKYNFNFIVLLIFTFSISCNHKESLVKYKIWKYRDGYSIGDVFDIENNYIKMVNDTIYEKDNPIALFINIENRFFSDNILTIRSLKQNRTGEYCEK